MSAKNKLHEPTKGSREQIREYTAAGLTQEQMAVLIDLDLKTLRKYYSDDMKKGEAYACSKVGGTIFQRAIDGDVTAMIWYSKTRMGWKEAKEDTNINLSGNITGAITFVGKDADKD